MLGWLYLLPVGSKQEMMEQIRHDIQDFKQSRGLDKVRVTA